MARVESKTYIVTADKYEAVPHTKPGVEPILGHWMSPDDMQKELDERFRGCMAGKFLGLFFFICLIGFHLGNIYT